MYDTDFSLSTNNIRYTDDGVANIPLIPLPDRNRIHPLDRKFKKLIRNKLKLFISSSK